MFEYVEIMILIMLLIIQQEFYKITLVEVTLLVSLFQHTQT